MEDDDDGPPMLVAADGSTDATEVRLSADMDGVNLTKVPITIITGRLWGSFEVQLTIFRPQ